MRKTIIRIMLFVLIMSFGLAGCAQQIPKQNEPVTGVIDEGSMPVLTQDSGPAKGGRLNLFMTTPDSLNPIYSANPYVRYMSLFVFDPLFAPDGEKNSRNMLAETWQLSTDGLMLDIKLRDGVTYHDGTPLAASDVAFTIQAIQKSGKGIYGGNVENISSTKVSDRLHIRLILKKADTDILSKLTFPILPESTFKDWPIEGYDPAQKLVGSGAYKFVTMDDKSITLSRNDNWWYASVEGGPNHTAWMDGINFKIYNNENDMMQAFQKQEIDLAFVTEGNLDSYANRTDILYNRYEGNEFDYILFSAVGAENNRMSDQAFRSALIKYLNWYMTQDPIALGTADSEESGDSVSLGSIKKEDTITALTGLGMTYDLEKNVLYYFKNGSKIPFTLSVKYNSLDPDRVTTGEWIQKALSEIGISVSLDKSNETEEKNLVSSGKFDMMILGSRIPLYSNLDENIGLLKQNLNCQNADAVILPLYRKNEAVLYNPKIKGPRLPTWKNVLDGWMEWYLVQAPANP